MVTKAFRMRLFPGFEEEYRRRHDELWPEMRDMLAAHGARAYSIYLDLESHYLIGILEIADESLWDQAAGTEINQKWWKYMADIMETNPDNSPVTVALEEVFTL